MYDSYSRVIKEDYKTTQSPKENTKFIKVRDNSFLFYSGSLIFVFLTCLILD